MSVLKQTWTFNGNLAASKLHIWKKIIENYEKFYKFSQSLPKKQQKTFVSSWVSPIEHRLSEKKSFQYRTNVKVDSFSYPISINLIFSVLLRFFSCNFQLICWQMKNAKWKIVVVGRGSKKAIWKAQAHSNSHQ